MKNIVFISKSGRTPTSSIIQRTLDNIVRDMKIKEVEWGYRAGPKYNNPKTFLETIEDVDSWGVVYLPEDGKTDVALLSNDEKAAAIHMAKMNVTTGETMGNLISLIFEY